MKINHTEKMAVQMLSPSDISTTLTKDNSTYCDSLNDNNKTVKNSILSGGLRLFGRDKNTAPGKPLVSVITVVFNGDRHLEETIKSVLNQTYKNIEYIIIDGGSTDETINIIRKYSEEIDYWISERDSGIYDAMNKGIDLARGEIIALLNADDYYTTINTIATVVDSFTNFDEFVVSDASIVKGDKILVFKGKQPTKLFFNVPFVHPACFISRKLYIKHGLYNTKYRISADVDFIFRLLVNQVTYKIINQPLVSMRTGGESDKQYYIGRREYFAIYLKHYRNIISGSFGYIYSILLFEICKLKKHISP